MMAATTDDHALRGELRANEPLANYTTWRVGGPARCLYRPADLNDLSEFLAQLPADEPLLWLGLGSNLLVHDAGFPGTVINTLGVMNRIEKVNARHLRAECGASCASVARFAARSELCGAEFLAGIPGTVGGALAMNAGAFGGETWPLVREVLTIDRNGQVRSRRPGEYRIAYRKVEGPAGEWFVAAALELAPGDSDAGSKRIRSLLEQRSASQPIGLPSCGSVFKNPPDDHAARLIEAAGLKGLRSGGAVVSDKHANFIINDRNARAADIMTLIERVQEQVAERFGVHLETEVRMVGGEGGAQ